MNTLAIIQARMGSSRLPGKVLLDLAGKPMIQRVIERVQRAQTVHRVLIATTTDPADEPIAQFAAQQGVDCYRGSLHDVLDRFYQAAQCVQPDVIIRITADCPLIEPSLIDETVRLMREPCFAPIDFACNRLPPPFTRTFPIGLDVEVCTSAALERAWREASAPFHREHVMPYIYEGVTLMQPASQPVHRRYSVCTGISPRQFHIAQLQHTPDYGSLRWTVDTIEDLTFIRELYARLPNTEEFDWYDVLHTVQQHPELSRINATVQHKTMTDVDERANPAIN
ncbi:MAG: hypothetical protein DDG60_16320 [Anaerolineae bacterium]|nr:MAG: hypothetical protein DDG60_16320 [Anaerolineae bacterium]